MLSINNHSITKENPFKLCFVCLGNICRSPTAEGVFQHLVNNRGLQSYFEINSAGTSAYHIGEGANSKSQKIANKHGVKLLSKARQFESFDLGYFDLIIAMDKQNLSNIRQLDSKNGYDEKIMLLREFDPTPENKEVPDPYYGGINGFENVFNVVERSCKKLLDELEKGLMNDDCRFMISESLRTGIEQLLEQSIKNFKPISGGSINQAAKISTVDNQTFFLKWNRSAPSDMFPKEEKGLNILRKAETGIHIPEVIGFGETFDGADFLVMEYISEGSAHVGSARQFGRQLATLHKNTVKEYGLNHDNYIGKLPQSNTRHNNWINFFIEERLEPQLEQAVDDGKLPSSIIQKFQELYKKLPAILADEPASLLHGDLWSGNYFYDTDGKPVMYDPAVHYGNREIELAFTHLFGGFSTDFYDAYEEAFPMQPNFSERKDIYNLYPLLVHTNLFGGSYARQVEAIVEPF